MADAPRKVKVVCAVRAGIVLLLHEKVDVGFGIMGFRPKRGADAVRVPFGESEVDEALIDEWLAQHAESVIVKEGMLKKWPPPQP
jgi:hypothetical protein